MDWKKYSFVVRAKNRKKILKALKEPKTPTQLSKETKINLSHVSRSLRELMDKDLVKCLTPDQTTGRVYDRTETGEKIVEKIAEKT